MSLLSILTTLPELRRVLGTSFSKEDPFFFSDLSETPCYLTVEIPNLGSRTSRLSLYASPSESFPSAPYSTPPTPPPPPPPPPPRKERHRRRKRPLPIVMAPLIPFFLRIYSFLLLRFSSSPSVARTLPKITLGFLPLLSLPCFTPTFSSFSSPLAECYIYRRDD